MTQVNDTAHVVINGKPQVWTVLCVEPDPNGSGKRVMVRVQEGSKEPWLQVVQETNYRRRTKYVENVAK